jgi:hypothetical protein
MTGSCGWHAPPMSVSAMRTLAPGMLTVAAPYGSGGTPAAVTDGGGGADMRCAKSRRSVLEWSLRSGMLGSADRV